MSEKDSEESEGDGLAAGGAYSIISVENIIIS